MVKKIMALLLALAMCMSLAACGNDSEKPSGNDQESTGQADPTSPEAPPEEPEVGPEEIAAVFIRAMYCGDLDAILTCIPEFAYDVMIEMGELEVPEGGSKTDAVRDYLANNMAQEPEELATDVQLETKISDTMTQETYMDTAREFYVSEGIVSEDDMEEIEEAVFVAFNCDVTYANGETRSLKDFESAVPCVKIDGKWYADMLYLLFVPVKVEPGTGHL